MLALAMALAATSGCRHSAAEDTHESEGEVKRVVHCVAAERLTVKDEIVLQGTVAPRPEKDAEVAAQVAGRIMAVMVREGDAVSLGQVLARIDDGPLVDQAAEAEAALSKARAEHKNAEATKARTERVFAHGIAARQEVEDATTRADTASAAEHEAEAAAKRARRQVARALLRSPLAGLVVRVMRRPGELVDGTAATPVLEVADPTHLELLTAASAADLVRVSRGTGVTVTVAALPGHSWPGQVAAVSPAVDRASGLGSVRVGLADDALPRPPLGVLGTARIAAGPARVVMGVPKEVFRSASGEDAEVVVCGSDGAAHALRVRRGLSDGVRIEAQGLSEGQKVALDPVGLVDGQAIEPKP